MTPVLSDPELRGPLLVLAPHMDDEVLGCGGLLARWPDRERVRVLYATNGRGAENLRLPGVRVPSNVDMGAIRRAESEAALMALGLSPACALRLDIPEFGLRDSAATLAAALEAELARRVPAWVLVPFRYDRHPDHLALNRIARTSLQRRAGGIRVLEYFVYYRWRLLPSGDVRRLCQPERRLQIPLGEAGALKAAALRAYRSQTTCFFPWQLKPVLSEALVQEVCSEPECFLRAQPEEPDRLLLRVPPPLLGMVQRLESYLKTRKEQMTFLWRYRCCRGKLPPQGSRPEPGNRSDGPDLRSS